MADDRLPPSPDTPNCVSSDAPAGDSHHIEPFRLNTSPDDAWAALLHIIENTPRVTIVERTATRLRAEFKVPVLGFVDDVEFQLRADNHTIAVRSVSRIGTSDFGVNRRRVEGLRRKLRKAGAVGE